MARQHEFVTAWLNDIEYGFDSAQIEEIRSLDPNAIVPRPLGCVVGRLGAGESGVPVVDLRLQQGTAHVTYRKSMLVVIVATVRGHVGVIVDSISDLVDVEFDGDPAWSDCGLTVVYCRSTGGSAQHREQCALRVADAGRLLPTVGATSRVVHSRL